MFMPIKGAIVSDTTYVDNVLAAKDVSFTLPSLTAMTTDIPAMGTMTMPQWGLLEDMESSVTKIGVDLGFCSLVEPKTKTVEHRWIQTVTDANGNTSQELCKAFLRCIPKVIPELSVELGSSIEADIPFAVTRYQLFVAGREMVFADRLAGKLRVNGKDYSGITDQL